MRGRVGDLATTAACDVWTCSIAEMKTAHRIESRMPSGTKEVSNAMQSSKNGTGIDGCKRL
jgi:hypothetical protein